jgi:hypothetical protein
VVAILSRGYRSKPPPLSKRLIDKMLLRDDRTPPRRIVSDGKSPLARFGNGRRRAAHARVSART